MAGAIANMYMIHLHTSLGLAIFTALFLISGGQRIGTCDGGKFQDHLIYNTDSSFESLNKTIINNVRSMVECAVLCRANYSCQTAVFESNNKCLLISKPINILFSVNTGVGYSKLIDFSHKNTHIETSNLCPSTCTGTSVCALDCSLSSGEKIPGCMELATSQYTSNGCAFKPQIRGREYYLANLDIDTSTTWRIIFSVKFEKEFADTALRVRFRGTIQGAYGCAGCWTKLHIYFNGAACTSPGRIDYANYNGNSDVRHYKACGIMGICYNIPKGLVTIDMRTETANTNSYTHIGKWTNGSRFFVDEMPLYPQASEPPQNSCPGLTAFNTRELVHDYNFGNDPTTHLWNIAFTKVEDATTLKIVMDVSIRVYVHSNTDSCTAWYIRVINGVDCSPYPIAKVIGNHNNPDNIFDEHKTVEIEGYCRGVNKGSYNLQLHVYNCPFYSYSSLDANTGWNQLTRSVIEEFREGTNVISAVAPDGILFRIPQFNMYINGQSNPAHGGDVGNLWTLHSAYNKLYSSSGISVSLSADGRAFHGGNTAYSICCRFYFTFNGNECKNPGPIEGISALNKPSNIHRPMYIEGICRDIPAGAIKVELQVGPCKGETGLRDCYYGWNSYTHAMISETFYEHENITSYP